MDDGVTCANGGPTTKSTVPPFWTGDIILEYCNSNWLRFCDAFAGPPVKLEELLGWESTVCLLRLGENHEERFVIPREFNQLCRVQRLEGEPIIAVPCSDNYILLDTVVQTSEYCFTG